MCDLCRKLIVVFFLVSLGCAPPPDLTDPESAALAWLSEVDGGNFASAWSESSSVLRQQLGESDWIENLQAIREPLGSIENRSLDSVEQLDSLPEAPEGVYAMLYFSSAFRNNAHISEVVVLYLEQDGSWRTLGYYTD